MRLLIPRNACKTQLVLPVRVCTATRLSLQPANHRCIDPSISLTPSSKQANTSPSALHPALPPCPCSSVRFALHRSRIATECEMLARLGGWSHRFPNPACSISCYLICLVRRLRNGPCHILYAAAHRVQHAKLSLLLVAARATALGLCKSIFHTSSMRTDRNQCCLEISVASRSETPRRCVHC